MKKTLLSFALILLGLGTSFGARAADPGLVIDEQGIVSVLEGGIVDTYTVALLSAPTANVTVKLTAPIEQILVNPKTLTFTKDNWAMAQTITVEAFDDLNYEQSHQTLITHETTSADAAYDKKSGTVTVFITDNDNSGSNGGRDNQLPDLPTGIKLSSDGKKVSIIWIDPIMPDFRLVEIMRNSGGTTPVDAGNPYAIAKGEQVYVDTMVTSGETYTYQLRSKDWSTNVRLSSEYKVKVEVNVAPPAPVAPTPVTPVPTPTPVVPVPMPQSVDTTVVVSDAKEFGVTLSGDEANAAAIFYLYGNIGLTAPDFAKKLGSGERRALLRDYFDTTGRAVISWEDITRLAAGAKPVNRNLERERAQAASALKLWMKIKGRAPNFKNASEDLAWNTMLYRIRFDRNLVKESAGITRFKALFGRVPVSPMDWATVRALGYVL